LINPLVSQLPVDPYVAMNTGFANVLANGHVVGDSHTAQGSLSHFLIYLVPSVVIYGGGWLLASQLWYDPIVDL